MKKKIILTVIAIFISLLLLKISLLPLREWKANLVNPMGQLNSLVSTPAPVVVSSATPTPKTYNFDSTTDLKKELDSIDPQVLDSDFN